MEPRPYTFCVFLTGCRLIFNATGVQHVVPCMALAYPRLTVFCPSPPPPPPLCRGCVIRYAANLSGKGTTAKAAVITLLGRSEPWNLVALVNDPVESVQTYIRHFKGRQSQEGALAHTSGFLQLALHVQTQRHATAASPPRALLWLEILRHSVLHCTHLIMDLIFF